MTERVDYEKASAAGVRARGSLYVYVGNSGLPKQLIDLVFSRASQINGSGSLLRNRAGHSHLSIVVRAGVLGGLPASPGGK